MDSNEQYGRPVPLAEGVYWVGFHEEETNFHSNPYLLVEGDQAVLIDGGSRPDFAVVMMKILQSGLLPSQIRALVYQHCDPDLCGSISNMVDMIDSPSLKILCHSSDKIFIKYYLEKEAHRLLETIDRGDRSYGFHGRTLLFRETPYSHNAGSFVTYDCKTKTLFSSDLFGSLSSHWDFFTILGEDCYACTEYARCPQGRPYCPLPDIFAFHRKVMPAGKALRHAMSVIRGLDIERIAPQHGSVIPRKRDIAFLIEKLAALDGVGIDAFPEPDGGRTKALG